MIKKTLANVIFATTLSFSSFSFAADLEHNMEILGKNFKAFNTTDNQKDALKALGNMKSAALDAKKVKLKTKDAKALTSDALFDQLVAQIDQTTSLVQAGKLDQAKVEAKKIAVMKAQGHGIYNHH